ncbi:MAG: NAD(P)-binding domain-containing protein [Pseudomonadota bacterium]
MKHVTTVIIGAGQCGLAMSRALSSRAIDHVVLERNVVGNSWHHERWDSLRLLTPNWMNVFFGRSCGDPDGYMHSRDFARILDLVAADINAPVETNTEVRRVSRHGDGYRVETDRDIWSCDSVVLASGGAARPSLPDFHTAVPGDTNVLTAATYRRPQQIAEGRVLVVGASASGLQIASELNEAGRDVVLAVGQHLRLPRRYRGADILTWMHVAGILDTHYTEVDDIDRLRRAPSLALQGDPSFRDLDLNTLQNQGVEIVGRLAAINDGNAWFSGGLPNLCTSSDLKLKRLLERIDTWISDNRPGPGAPAADTFVPTRFPDAPRLSIGLSAGRVGTIIWATGFIPDHRFVNLPVFDHKGHIRHNGGKVAPGLYVLGLPYLRRARSSHISGAVGDAQALATHLADRLPRRLYA